jgi:3'-phosphoadenosine 5'-phosphosulfate sulfotransferase (PAPS reductase)/FAD synthetase
MMDNEFLLMDRIQKIQQIVGQYGEENFYISFSGGKDSTVLSALVDMAIPKNTIPRVYANTGIEYRLILEFVERERERASVGVGYLETICANKTDVGK